MLALAVVAAHGSGDLWPHLLRYVLPNALAETALYLLGVGLVVVLIGASTAWLVSMYQFPFRRLLSWALLLPLAMPGYIAAYAYLDVLHPVGPVQSTLRALLGITDPRGLSLPDIRSLGGCILVLGLVLYPYVYLSARSAFALQAADALWAARSLGASGFTLFSRIGIPMARPALAVGLSLALMEALNDVGASEFLGVRTLTVSIYVTWLNRGSLEGAAQIALVLVGLVVLLLSLERWGRKQYGFIGDVRPYDPIVLTGARAVFATAACAFPIAFGFLVPVAHLTVKAWERVAVFGLPAELGVWIGNSAWFASWAALATVLCGLVLAFVARVGHGGVFLRLGTMGYALPGGVAAVGLIIALGTFDDGLAALWRLVSDAPVSWTALGSSAALIMAYVVRFLAIPAAGLDAAYARLGIDYDNAARGLGCHSARLLRSIHCPLLIWPLGAATLLVFIDAMKELPATLLLRPVNVETLSTALYGEAVRGTYEEGAVAALALVLVAMLAAALLAPLENRARRGVDRRLSDPPPLPDGLLRQSG